MVAEVTPDSGTQVVTVLDSYRPLSAHAQSKGAGGESADASHARDACSHCCVHSDWNFFRIDPAKIAGCQISHITEARGELLLETIPQWAVTHNFESPGYVWIQSGQVP